MWDEWEQQGRMFWEKLVELVDMLDGLKEEG
jgi:hypothetical protein